MALHDNELTKAGSSTQCVRPGSLHTDSTYTTPRDDVAVMRMRVLGRARRAACGPSNLDGNTIRANVQNTTHPAVVVDISRAEARRFWSRGHGGGAMDSDPKVRTKRNARKHMFTCVPVVS